MDNYIPSKVVVGKLRFCSQDLICPSFLVCKYKNKWWTNDNQFKSLVGYTRYDESKCENNIERDIKGVVFEVENTPISGMKIIPKMTNMYYEKYWNNVYILEDPRGFSFAISYHNLVDIISKTTIVNGVVQDKLVYSMPNFDLESSAKESIMRVSVYDYVVDDFEQSKTYDRQLEYQKIKIARKDLVPGNIYAIDSKNRDETKKYVFVGNVEMFKKTDFLGQDISRYLDRSKNFYAYWSKNVDSFSMPWNCQEYKTFYNSIKTSRMNVFVDVDNLLDIEACSLDESTVAEKCLKVLKNHLFYKKSRNKINFAVSNVILRNPSLNSIKGIVEEDNLKILEKARKFVDIFVRTGKTFADEVKLNFPIEKPKSKEAFDTWIDSPYLKLLVVE